MPWKFKKKLYLYLLGCIAMALAITVYVRHKSVDLEILATLGLVGGLAIIINNLPDNGNGNGKEGKDG
jgi:formate-dependent nitrite reductase membrane component NrfD